MTTNLPVPYAAPPPPELVDPRGRPLREAVATLTREISAPTMAGVRSIIAGHPAQGLDPVKLGRILRDAEQGDATAYLELAEEIEEKYPHYQSVLGTRKRAVSQLPITVKAAGTSPEEEADAQLVRDWVDGRLTLQGELRDILDAIGKGFSVTEIVWRFTAQAWLPEALKWRHPQFFEFDQVTGEQLLLKGGIDGTSGLAQPLSQFKYITHFAAAKSGSPIRGGLARTVAWYYLFVNFTIKDWITFLEVYGLPLRVGKYQNGTSEADIRKLAEAVAQIGSDAGCVIPQSMMIEFVQSGGAASNPEMFQRFLTYADDQVSKAVLGQTSSADAKSGGLGSGQASLHGEVRDDIRDADAVEQSVTLSRDLAIPIVMLNRGPRPRYPLILVGKTDEVDMGRELTAIDAAVRYGLEVGQDHVRKVTGVPAPQPGEKLISMPASIPAADPGAKPPEAVPGNVEPPSPAQGPQLHSNGRSRRSNGQSDAEVPASIVEPERKLDEIDRLVDAALADWTELTGPMIGAFDEMIAAATSMDEVRELLALRAGDIIDAMPVEAIVQLGERAGFAARIAGIVGARER